MAGSCVVFIFCCIDGCQSVHRDESQSVRKHGCCMYVADSLLFVRSDVDLINVAGVFLLDLDVYVLVGNL